MTKKIFEIWSDFVKWYNFGKGLASSTHRKYNSEFWRYLHSFGKKMKICICLKIRQIAIVIKYLLVHCARLYLFAWGRIILSLPRLKVLKKQPTRVRFYFRLLSRFQLWNKFDANIQRVTFVIRNPLIGIIYSIEGNRRAYFDSLMCVSI